MKYRICKRVLGQLPAPVASAIERLGKDHEIKSFTFEKKSAPFALGLSEGSRYTAIYGDREMSIEMVAEHNLGAAGVSHKIGSRVPIPVGAVIIEVWYYAGFGMHVINVDNPALPATL